MKQTTQWITVVLMMLLTGCQSGNKAEKISKPSKSNPVALSTADFVQADGQTTSTVIPASNVVPTAQPTDTQTPTDNLTKAQAATYQVAGMVGQVNGKPIYARSIFKDVHERLTDLGTRLPAATFRQQASALLQGRLRQIVMDALVLGEAEKQLNEQSQMGILHYLKEERKKLIRELGRGSEELANQKSRMTSGMTLDQRISEKRNQVIVQNYLRDKLWPKINVSRKDVERYYHDHFDQFNPPKTRTIHMIRTNDDNVANHIDKALTDGRNFLDVAGDNVLNPRDWEKKGLFGEDIKGKPFGLDALNDATLALNEGEHTRRLKIGSMHTWVYIAKLQQAQTRSLRESQLEIENILKQQQYNRYTEEYQQRLMDEGSYNDIREMHAKLLDICMSIYVAQP